MLQLCNSLSGASSLSNMNVMIVKCGGMMEQDLLLGGNQETAHRWITGAEQWNDQQLCRGWSMQLRQKWQDIARRQRIPDG